MEYTLSRYEKNRDHDGKIISIFIALNISSGEESICQEHWLTEEEMSDVSRDELTLQPILERIAAEGENRLEKIIATKPQPPIVYTKDELEKFEIKPEGVEKYKKELKEEEITPVLKRESSIIEKVEEPVSEDDKKEEKDNNE